MRTFIAIAIPDELKNKIRKIQEKLDMLDIDAKLVEIENLHFNLKFLGEITEEDVNKVKAVLNHIIPKYNRFSLHITGLGAFPQITYARVIWLGAREGVQQLTALAEAVELALADMGFRQEEKVFTPHITLARINSGQHKQELVGFLKDEATVDIGYMEVNEVILFKSELTPKGPIYTQIHTVKLS